MNPSLSSSDQRLAAQLHALLAAIEASGHALLPQTNLTLLHAIVEAAARIFGAVAAAIALVTEDGQELEFKVAYNVINQNIVGMRFPVASGIAGHAAQTGQPLVVSGADQDERFNRSFAEQSGYIPKSIIAVPLILNGQVIGVIEALDKVSGENFDQEDVALMTLFAHQAAFSIGQSQPLANLQHTLINGLKQTALAEQMPPTELLAVLDSQPPSSPTLIHLAKTIQAISAQGETDRETCLKILRAFQQLRPLTPKEGV
ncbi:MAG TPA: GAF domain-containing protein [Anaerolineales bacterium]|nr:GAF domain-containing protein [Anaerolineales bacterium]